MELNIEKFEISQKSGLILNRWEIARYDRNGFELPEKFALALTFDGEHIDLILKTNADDFAPNETADEWIEMLTMVGDGEIEIGLEMVKDALQWIEEHIDENECALQDDISEIRWRADNAFEIYQNEKQENE